jgi:hypothetical protein
VAFAEDEDEVDADKVGEEGRTGGDAFDGGEGSSSSDIARSRIVSYKASFHHGIESRTYQMCYFFRLIRSQA